MLSVRQRRKGGTYYVRGQVMIGSLTRAIDEHSTGTTDVKMAQAYAARLESQLHKELLVGPQVRVATATLADAAALYLAKPGGHNNDTVWRVEQICAQISSYALPDMKAGWQQFIVKRCAGLAPATVERFRSVVQAILNHYAEAFDAPVPKLRKIRFQNQIARFLILEERDRLIGAYAAHVQPIILMLAYQGCRTQEALQLQWRHVDLEKQTLYFARTKNGEPRMVPMHRVVAQALGALHRRHGTPAPSGHVFLNIRGQPYQDTRDAKLPGGNPLKRAHETACKRADITSFRIHDWRHHWASHAVMAGLDIETIRRLGGWKDLRMLQRYASVSVEHMRAAMAKIE
jgi:integrase